MNKVQKKFSKKIFCGLLIVLFCVALVLPAAAAPNLPSQARAFHKQVTPAITGEYAYEVVEYMAVDIVDAYGHRRAGTVSEFETAYYIAGQFEAMGYEVELQLFNTDLNRRCGDSGATWTENIDSLNVVATKPGRGNDMVVLGAHIDSKTWCDHCPDCFDLENDPQSHGAGDNASGVGVMLEVARFLADYPTHATIKFIAFGAEEVGLRGSRHYVNELTPKEIENTVAMINLDMVGIGENFNVYAGMGSEGLGGETWVRDMAMDIGKNMGHDIRTTPDESYAGFVGGWSDHAPFTAVDIPIAYFEWWYWDEDPWWGHEMATLDTYYHTAEDTIDKIDIDKLRATGEVVSALVYEISRNPLPQNTKGINARAKKYNSFKVPESVK